MQIVSNFRLPPEWAPQEAVLLAWPHAKSDWRPWLQAAEKTYCELTHALLPFAKVIVLCQDESHKAHILGQLGQVDSKRLLLIPLPYNDTWTRDYGPITVLGSNEAKWLHFEFNAWGGKFNATLDDQATQRLYQALQPNATYERHNWVLEGGSIETDGAGTLLTTKQCLLNQARNTDKTQADIEIFLKKTLGLTHIIWLTHGNLEGDDTDSHIDTLARFCSPTIIAAQACDNPSDPHYAPLQRMLDELRQCRNAQGEPYTVVPLPWPRAQFAENGKRLPAGYANFLILNQGVLVPLYGVPEDEQALACFKKIFPHHRVVGVNCRVLIEQFGSLHCATMQLTKC